MEQTTVQTDKLLTRIDDLTGELQALRVKNVFLTQRLEQRLEKTVSHYKRVMPYLKAMRDKILKIFLEQPYYVGLSHQEIIEEFSRCYPAINTKNVPRRIRELVEEDKLWSRQEPDGKARFFLKLIE